MKKARTHEWTRGWAGINTVCGLMPRHFAGNLAEHAVNDLGDVDVADRCKNCERMRAAIGASRQPKGLAAP
jgi:hypothetical protein